MKKKCKYLSKICFYVCFSTGDPTETDMDTILILTKDSYFVAEYVFNSLFKKSTFVVFLCKKLSKICVYLKTQLNF